MIDPTSGVFAWEPAAFQGGLTYRVEVRVTDDGNPPLAASQAFNITVRDTRSDFRLSLASTHVVAGEDGSVPLILDSGADLLQLDFELETSDPHLSEFELLPESDEVAAIAFEPAGEGVFRAQLELDPSRLRTGERVIGRLHFSSAIAGHSSVARLGVSGVAGYRLGGEALLNAVGRGGRVFVIEVEPLLDATLTAPNQLRLTLYGFPNTVYRLEESTQLGRDAVWTEVQS